MNQTIHLGDELKNGQGMLRLPRMTDEMFIAFCQRNPELRVERSARGNLILMSPADYWTESCGDDLLIDLGNWNRSQGSPGRCAGSSAGFTLPNGAVRSPDASWMSWARLQAIPPENFSPFPHGSPEFAVEVMSPSDSLAATKRKMEEYMANGVLLAWLIDRRKRTVFVYRPNQAVLTVNNPETLSAAPELPGFTANIRRVFDEIPTK